MDMHSCCWDMPSAEAEGWAYWRYVHLWARGLGMSNAGLIRTAERPV